MSVIGYTRVSSKDQNLSRQEDSLKEKGVEKVYSDKMSGKNTDRPGLKELLSYVREGDTVIVHSFDRLARSLPDLLQIVDSLREKGVELQSLKEAVDTATPQGKLQLALFGALAEFEREITGQRRDEGIRSARARGQRFGRPEVKKPAHWDQEIRRWKAGKQTAVETFERLKMSKTTFYKLVKQEQEGVK